MNARMVVGRLIVPMICWWFSAPPVHAQAPVTGCPDPGWVLYRGAEGVGCVPPDHPLASPPAPPSPPMSLFPWSSDPVTPYDGWAPFDDGTRFQVGRVYQEPYNSLIYISAVIGRYDGRVVFVGECLGPSPQSVCPPGRLLYFEINASRGIWVLERDDSYVRAVVGR